ncbi:MAG: LCP family protein [Candidatus Saganbacteria bacterium]|nr:LCP family protein [Candidatus Saganbacteria bacterium]
MKKFLIVTMVFLICLAAFVGFTVSLAARLALFDVFLSLTPSLPIIGETNLLVLGVDNTGGRLSDTIMVLHVNPDKKSAAVVSIPRDTVVIIPDRGLNKINAAYAFGGSELARRTAEELLHVAIPYDITVDLSEVEKIVDKLGGITVNVEKRMYYVDYAGGLDIDLQPGLQKLNGRQALGYLRFRHTDNDFARIGRQQNFLRDLAAEMIKRENLIKSPSLFLSMVSCINTNLNSREILGLALALRSASELGQISMTTLPGSDLMVDGIYYYKPNEADIARITDLYLTSRTLAASN